MTVEMVIDVFNVVNDYQLGDLAAVVFDYCLCR